MKNYIMKLSPYVSETIWGGRKLINEYNVKTEKSNAAEGWMLSGHKSGPSTVINGELSGWEFDKVAREFPELLGTNAANFDRFPILIKFIDAMDDLSVQVHPTAEYCKLTGKGQSKTECWYIIDCEENAGLLLGFKDKLDSETFKKAIETNTLTEYTDFVKVKKGDFFFIESGTLHAICKGILLAEVQESSDTTYRIYDYGRKDKNGNQRELHVADAINVTKLEKYTQPSFAYGNIEHVAGKNLLTDSPLFKVWLDKLDGNDITDSAEKESFVSLLITDGSGKLKCQDEIIDFKKGDSLFIPAGSGKYTISGCAEIIETRI